MNKTINITVKDKIATAPKDAMYICGNSDFVINFDFDSEWDEFETKTARFKVKGNPPIDKIFSGNVCPIPKISDTYSFEVGVYAGDLHTTTPAYVPARKSILCGGGTPADPPDDVYNQIMERLNEIGTPSPEAIAAAVADYIAEHPITETDPTVPAWAKAKEKPEYTAKEVGAIAETELQTAINTALAQAKASGEFDGADGKDGADGQPGADGKDGADGAPGADGADGKSAYAYAVEGGYTGTEAEFAAKLAAEMPEALPNPSPLELIDPDTGDTLASYDGSEAVAVEIPNGGGESAWETLIDTTLAEAAGLDTGEVPGKTEMLCVFAVPKCDAAISLTASSKAFGKALVGFSVGSSSYGKIGFIFGRKVGGHATAIAASGDTTSTAPGLDTTPRAAINLNYFRITDAPTDVPLKITSALPAGTIIKVFVR